MSQLRCAAIDSSINGIDVVLACVKTETGMLFIRYHIKTGTVFANEVLKGDSITQNMGTLVPEFLLGILVGKINA
jgi:hypothetical protein